MKKDIECKKTHDTGETEIEAFYYQELGFALKNLNNRTLYSHSGAGGLYVVDENEENKD